MGIRMGEEENSQKSIGCLCRLVVKLGDRFLRLLNVLYTVHVKCSMYSISVSNLLFYLY